MKRFGTATTLLVTATSVAQVPQSSPIATGTLIVRGRCVDFANGAPLQRCRVQLSGHQSTGYPMAWVRTDWADPPEVTTSVDGTFRFELRLPAPDEALDRGRYHLRISHAHHAGWFSHCAFVVAADQGGVDYGDVRLPQGVRPRIRCEDADRALQPGVLLVLQPRPGGAAMDDPFVHAVGHGPHWWIERSAHQRTDVDGYLHFANPLPPGDYTLSVRERQERRVPELVELPRADAVVVVVEPLDRTSSITGRLVDESGHAIENSVISDGDDGDSYCSTRRDGAFTLIRAKPTGQPTASLRLAQNRRYDGWLILGDIDWGRREVELVVPARTLHTFVVRTQDGAPVEDFNLYCLPMRSGDQGTGVRLAGSFTGGRADCRVAAGEYQLLVAPRSDRLPATGWEPIVIDASRREIPVVVPRAIARTVAVVFAADGTAAVGALVEAVSGEEPDHFGWLRPATNAEFPAARPGQARSQLIASARTDERGRATLMLGQARPSYLRVSEGGVRNSVVAADLAGGHVHPIPVERGATLFGSLGPLDTLCSLDPEHDPGKGRSIYDYHRSWAPTLTIVCGEGERELRREGIRLDTKGHFRSEGLPPGPVEVTLRYWKKDGAPNGRRTAAEPMVLGTGTLHADAPQQMNLRLPGAGQGR